MIDRTANIVKIQPMMRQLLDISTTPTIPITKANRHPQPFPSSLFSPGLASGAFGLGVYFGRLTLVLVGFALLLSAVCFLIWFLFFSARS